MEEKYKEDINRLMRELKQKCSDLDCMKREQEVFLE